MVDILEVVELVFVPPNNTSKTTTWSRSSGNISLHFIPNYIPTIRILDAIRILVQSWNGVSKKSLLNCFRSAGISFHTRYQVCAIEGKEDPFKPLESTFYEIGLIDNSSLPEGTETTTFLDSDAYLIRSESTPVDDEDILAQFKESSTIYDKDEDRQGNCLPWKQTTNKLIFVTIILLLEPVVVTTTLIVVRFGFWIIYIIKFCVFIMRDYSLKYFHVIYLIFWVDKKYLLKFACIDSMYQLVLNN